MTAVDSAAARLRAFLTGDIGTYKDLSSRVSKDEQGVFAVMLAAAFHEATAQRFDEDYSLGDIIEFVADSRTRYPHVTENITAEAAETVFRAVLGEDELLDSIDRHGCDFDR